MATPAAALSEEDKEKYPPNAGGPRTGRTPAFAG